MATNCPKCARPLLQRAFGKCMYCGAELPPELRLSAADKQAHRQRLREAADAETQRLQQKRRRAIESHDSEPSGFGFGDSNCDGGGDCGGD